MNDSICPVCGKSNSNAVEICQYCGALLKKSATESLPAIHPGDEPVKKKSSDPELRLPDWLSSLTGVSGEPFPEQPESRPPEQQSTSKNEPPDWLSSLGGNFNSDEDTSGWSNPFVAEAPLAVEPQIKAQDEAEAAQPSQAESASTKTPQSEVESLSAALAGEQNIDSILAMDTPDWLSGFTLDEAEVETLHATSLPQGKLPSWVQAMRPIESVMAETNAIGEEQPEEVENQGPLAGLGSVLPAQPDRFAKQIVEAHSKKAYSTKLLTSETQQAQAVLLENLLNSENTPQAFSKRPETKINRLLRWFIAAVLLAAILIPAAFGSKIFPAPLMPVETGPLGMFIKTVTDLPDGAAVLVVMDYQPGFAGEMEAASGPVMEQLMSKKARLAFVSTTPLGGLMAERLLQKFVNIYPYAAGIQYVNLGYLPGGAGGIKVFAEQPRSTLGEDTLSGNLWDTPVLKDVTVNQETRLSNFAAVIVATDNPDTGRLWIEQAQPLLGSRPMLMVVSAQAEPMIRPYFLTNQLKGLVAGLEGGVLYESTQGKSGQARTYWDSFGVGMLATELLIIIGGVWSLISGLRARRATMEQDEA